jgi:hypothetical protein
MPMVSEIKAQANILPEGVEREMFPMVEGLLDYFPAALAEVSKISKIGSLKHNPGQPMHWARDKSTDHANKILRHLVDRGGFYEEHDANTGTTYRVRHSANMAWRALALLQTELEEAGLSPRGRASK